MKQANLKTYRRSFQVFVALAFIVIPLLNRSRYSMVYGNFLSFHMFGVPLADPLAVLQLTIKNFYFTIDNFIGTLLPLLLAFALGTVFCSWICPYGLLSEVTQKLSRKIVPQTYKGPPLLHKGFSFKMVVFVVGFIVFLIFSTTPVLNQLSTAAWYARFFQYYFGQDCISLCFLFLLSLLLIEFLAGKRLWCRYICPQSILIILAKICSRKRLRVVFVEEKCICRPGYERCNAACTLHLTPKTVSSTLETECSNCGDCVVACQKMGKALTFVFPALSSKTRALVALIPGPRKLLWGGGATIAVAAVIFSVVFAYRHIDFLHKERGTSIDHRLLSNKKIVWKSDKIGHTQLLASGFIIVSGGEWPLEGSMTWQWQPLDENGSFKIIPDAVQPESYTVVRAKEKIGAGALVSFEHVGAGISEYFAGGLYQITEVTDMPANAQQSAATVEGRVVLSHYAHQTFVLNLVVQDPLGVIKKIESQGDHIGMEGMLTNVKKWINSPEIIVAEGALPSFPFSTTMKVVFHDGHAETLRFETHAFVDRTAEEFDDPWF